jgi:hypothetical protein
MQGERYWVERAFEDGKGECGLADYQAVGDRAREIPCWLSMLHLVFFRSG